MPSKHNTDYYNKDNYKFVYYCQIHTQIHNAPLTECTKQNTYINMT